MFAALQIRELVVVVEGDEQNVAAADALATVLRVDMPALPAHGSVVADGEDDDDVGVDSMAQWPRCHAGPSFLALRIPQPNMQAFVSAREARAGLSRWQLAHFCFDNTPRPACWC